MNRRLLAGILILLLIPGMALAAGGSLSGMGIADRYEMGMDLFYLEDYDQAAEYFAAVGNYRDAKMWAYYCQAIDAVIDSKTTYSKDLEGAQARFELLAAQSFEDAALWAQYCKGRAYENLSMVEDARKLYAKTIVHDSTERYLKLLNKGTILDSADNVRKRMASKAAGTAGELFEAGMDLYYLEDYSAAADYFCLAGNYQDARKWRGFCIAIHLVTQKDNLTDAQVLFDMLCNQGFEAAEPWLVYCKGREYEKIKYINQAIDLYRTIFVFDSSERYLRLSGH